MKTHGLSAALAALLLFSAAPARADDEVVVQPPPPTVVNPGTPADQPKPPKQVPVGIRVDGGYALRTIEKLPLTGADVGVAFGAQTRRHLALWGEARLFVGSTENGLSTKSGRFNLNIDIVVDRFRFSIDPGIFIVGIERATRNQTIMAWGPKIGAAVRIDLIQADSFAFFARASADAGPTFSDGSLFGGFTFGGGIDFDIVRGDRSTL